MTLRREQPRVPRGAFLLTSIAVVCLVCSATPGPPGLPLASAQGPAFRVVGTTDEVDALPADCTAVELRELGQHGLEALAEHCPSLVHLRVRGGRLDPFGGQVVREKFPYLTSLDLSGAPGTLDVFVAEAVAVPGLQELIVREVDIATIVPMLPSVVALRHVDFGAAPWLTLTAVESLLRAGKRVTASKPGDPDFARELEELTERHADGLDLPYLRPVKSLAELRTLPAGISGVELHGLGDEAAQLLAPRLDLRAVAFLGDGEDPFTTTALERIGHLQQLQELRILVNSWSGDGADHLADLQGLRSLTLVGVGDAALTVLPRLRSLTRLTIIGGDALTATGIGDVARCAAVTDLRLSWLGTRHDQDLVALGGLKSVQKLDLSGAMTCGSSTLGAIGKLRALTSLDLSATGVAPEQIRGLARLRALRTLRLRDAHLTTDDLMTLPVSLRELSLAGSVGLDARAGAVLRDRLVELEVLDVSRCDWLDNEALQAILEVPPLRDLTVVDCPGPTDACIDALRAAENLRSLVASRSPFLDDEAAVALRHERPELRLNDGR